MAWRQLFRVQDKEQYFNCPHEVDFRESVRMFGTCLLSSPVPELHQDLQVPVPNRTELRPSDKPDFK